MVQAHDEDFVCDNSGNAVLNGRSIAICLAGDFRTEADDNDLVLREASGRTAALTHWSFGQLATIASAPPNYLRTLPAEIVQCNQLRARAGSS